MGDVSVALNPIWRVGEPRKGKKVTYQKRALRLLVLNSEDSIRTRPQHQLLHQPLHLSRWAYGDSALNNCIGFKFTVIIILLP